MNRIPRSCGTRLPGARLLGATGLGALALFATPVPAAAQSLLAGAGLGVPIEPLDARSRGLGGAGIGLRGWYVLASDPAAAGGLTLPAITATLQPSSATLSDGRSAGHARFPVLGVSYPYSGHVISVQLGSYLDQEWQVRADREIEIGGEPVTVEDQFRSSGSIAQARLGWARRIGDPLSVGVTVGRYVGSIERTFFRFLDPDVVGPDVEPFLARGRWRASGTTVGAGATWDASPILRLAGAVTWSGDLTLAPVGEGTVEEGSYAMPLELRGGGTFTLTSGLTLSVGATFADWSDTGEDLGGEAARGGTWSYGGGLEWTQATLLGRATPIRVGARQVSLPFLFDGAEASERIYAGGIGVHLVEGEVQPIARLELGLERGDRTAGALSESFWRTTVSVRLAGG